MAPCSLQGNIIVVPLLDSRLLAKRRIHRSSNNLSFLRKTRRAALAAMVSELRSKGLDCMVVQ